MDKKLLRENYYEAVNKDWLEKAVIPSDKPSMSAFVELHLEIEELLLELASKWDQDQTGLNDHLLNFVKLHKMTKDFDKRSELGVKPFKQIEELLSKVNSLKDLEEDFANLVYSSIDLPIWFSVMQDFMNSNNQVLYFGATGLFLPDTSYYHNEQMHAQLMPMFKMTTMQVLKLYGLSDEVANKLLEEAVQFDALLVPVTKSSVEAADYVKMYNPLTREEVKDKVNTLNILKIADTLVGEEIDKLVVTNLDFIEKFDEIINEENFELLKSWLLVSNYLAFASYLTEELRVAGGAFGRAMSGIQAPQAKEKAAFYSAYNSFSQVVGLYYGEHYFGPQAKEDVRHMVFEMIEVYKNRIRVNDWLQQETKEKAIKKVETLTVHVGYPDELPSYYDHFIVKGYEEGSNLLTEKVKMSEFVIKDRYAKYNKEPNKNLWQMPASMVNAYYSPQNNQIVFPAAILQKPYYSLDQHPSENYGGIGAVMAHEISHAFDNNGAKFDETGSLNNWWTESDLKAFEERSKDMIELFDGLETGHGKCNGELTVSENIADSGGIRAALEASKKDENHNIELFFKNWARVWRQKSSEQYAQLLLTVDVHGPAILRANMQLSNLEEFQDFYELKEDDPMFLAKDKMVKIW